LSKNKNEENRESIAFVIGRCTFN